MPLNTVSAGDKLAIPAGAWNEIVEAVRWYQRNARKLGAVVRSHDTVDGVVEVSPDAESEEDYVDIFSVVALDDILINHADNPDEFLFSRSVFTAKKFTSETLGKPFAILRNPLKDCLELATVSGVSPVRVDVSNESHLYAAVQAGSYNLKSADSGPCRILWKESGTGADKWAVALIGNPSGSFYDGYFAASNASDDEAQKVKITAGKAQVNETVFDVAEAVKTVTGASFIYLQSVYNELAGLPGAPTIEISTEFYSFEENTFKHLIAVVEWENDKIKKIVQQNYGMIVGRIWYVCEDE